MDPNDKVFQDELQSSLGNNSLDIACDIGEIGIDSLMTDFPEVLKSIPILNHICAIGKMGMSIKDYIFAQKLITFINEFNRGCVSEEAIKKFKEDLDSDSKFKSKILVAVASIVDRSFDEQKARIHSRLFQAFVGGYFTWDHFLSLSFSLEQLNPNGYQGLKTLYHSKNESIDRPHALSIYMDGDGPDYEATLIASGLASRGAMGLSMNQNGIDLFQFGIKFY